MASFDGSDVKGYAFTTGNTYKPIQEWTRLLKPTYDALPTAHKVAVAALIASGGIRAGVPTDQILIANGVTLKSALGIDFRVMDPNKVNDNTVGNDKWSANRFVRAFAGEALHFALYFYLEKPEITSRIKPGAVRLPPGKAYVEMQDANDMLYALMFPGVDALVFSLDPGSAWYIPCQCAALVLILSGYHRLTPNGENDKKMQDVSKSKLVRFLLQTAAHRDRQTEFFRTHKVAKIHGRKRGADVEGAHNNAMRIIGM